MSRNEKYAISEAKNASFKVCFGTRAFLASETSNIFLFLRPPLSCTQARSNPWLSSPQCVWHNQSLVRTASLPHSSNVRGRCVNTWQRRVLGILTLGGSSIGMLNASNQLSNADGSLNLVASAGLLVFAWGLFCGTRILEGAAKSFATSTLFWLLQVPLVQTAAVSYLFTSGAYGAVSIVLDPAGPRLNFQLQIASGLHFALGSPTDVSAIGINWLALWAVVVLGMNLRAASSNKALDPDAPPERGAPVS